LRIERPFRRNVDGREGSRASIRFTSPQQFEQCFMLAGAANP
jgi:hypothetical protein